MKTTITDKKVSILGLGYVGLPLAVALSKKFNCIGFDIDKKRIHDLINNKDATKEADLLRLNTRKISFTSNPSDLKNSDIFIVTVPTPVDKFNNPDLSSLISASEIIGKILKKGDLVIYESTVYPGATEEVCLPILEKKSKLKVNKDFHLGYSPERINPGDKDHKLENISKVISGSSKKAEKEIEVLYKSIIKSNIHIAPSIKVAEAAKNNRKHTKRFKHCFSE